MRKLFLCLCAILACPGFAQKTEKSWSADLFDGSIGFNAGYRRDQFSWDVIFTVPNGFPPFTTTETSLHSIQKWPHFNIFQVGFEGYFTVFKAIYLRGESYFGWNVDKGPQAPRIVNISLEPNVILQHSTSKTKDYTTDLTGGIGFQFKFAQDRVRVAPVFGYSYYWQKITEEDLANVEPFLISAAGAINIYKYTWGSPFAGCDLAFYPTDAWKILMGYEYHWHVRYQGIQTVLNAPPIFAQGIQYLHHAHGNVAKLVLDYIFLKHLAVGLEGHFRYFSAHNQGFHSIVPVPPGTIATIKNMKWISWDIMANIGVEF